MNESKAIVDWSRWLIGVGVVAIGGCMAFLNPDMAAEQHKHISNAVGAFIVSVIIAALLGGIAAFTVRVPGKCRLIPVVVLGLLAAVQLGTMGYGACQLYNWVNGIQERGLNILEESEKAAREAADAATRAANSAAESKKLVQKMKSEVEEAKKQAVQQHILEQIQAPGGRPQRRAQ